MVSNKLLQRYVSSKPNHVICIDTSFLTKNRCFFVGVDLATRVVVCHFFKSTPLETSDVIQCLDSMFKARLFTSAVEIVHSDRDSLFTNSSFVGFLESKGVEVSRGSSKGHQNQVVERLHRTLKHNLKKTLEKSYAKTSESVLKRCLNSVIENYNNAPHKSNYGLSPNSMDEAFLSYSPPVAEKENAVVLVENNDSSLCNDLVEVRKAVALNYANNWEAFFLDWRHSQAKEAERSFQETLYLRKELVEVRETLSELLEEKRVQQSIRKKRDLLKEKKSLAVKLPLRDVISSEELSVIMSLIKPKGFSNSRRRLAFCLLYLTGLRVSNLLCLNVRHVKDLFKTGEVTIPLIKKGPSRHKIKLSANGLLFLNGFKQDFVVLCRNKQVSFALFSSIQDLENPRPRQHFDEELNKILREASVRCGKHLRTHSFRATFITDLLVSTPIDEVKEFIGHKDIKTTLTYKRTRLTEKSINLVLRNLDVSRKK